MHPLIPHLLGREIHSIFLFGGQPRVSPLQADKGILAQLMCPLRVPLRSRTIWQEVPSQPEQDVLHFVRMELLTSVIEFVAELPGLRTQPQGAGLAARTEEGAPLARLLEQLQKSSASLHTSFTASLANRYRTSSMMSSGGLSTATGWLTTGGGGVFIPSSTRAPLHASACPHARPPLWAVSADHLADHHQALVGRACVGCLRGL